MSENFEMLFDVDVALEDAKSLSETVIKRFRNRGLIIGEPEESCVLGGLGYRPGPAVRQLYRLSKGEGRFWIRRTCGVEVKVGRCF